jgi:hypothetical protein
MSLATLIFEPFLVTCLDDYLDLVYWVCYAPRAEDAVTYFFDSCENRPEYAHIRPATHSTRVKAALFEFCTPFRPAEIYS